MGSPMGISRHIQMDTLYCGSCGHAVLRKKGNLLSFRKYQDNKVSDVLVEISGSSPFMFTCNNCGTRQLPRITLQMPKEEGGSTIVSIAGA